MEGFGEFYITLFKYLLVVGVIITIVFTLGFLLGKDRGYDEGITKCNNETIIKQLQR